MEIRIRTMTLTVLLLLLFETVGAENGVFLKADLQKITSSTLKWVPPNDDKLPEEAVIGSMEYTPIGVNENDSNVTDPSHIRTTRIFVCRTRLNGNWIPGALVEGTQVCVVSLVLKVFEQSNYQVLRSVDRAARVVWPECGRSAIPVNAVSAGEYFVARSVSSRLRVLGPKMAIGRTHLMGKLDPQSGVFGKLSVVDEDKTVMNDLDSGQVLVEVEPFLYELTITRLITSREKVLSRTSLTLGEVTLRNDLPSPMKVDSMISYQWKYSSNWGQGTAMLKGLETTIIFPNNTNVDKINWGITYDDIRTEMERVEGWLEAGTAMLVTLRATLSEIEVPYTGTLLSVFRDNTTMNRTIHGVWLRTVLADIKAENGPMYFFHNNSIVPTTTTTTTEAPTTTTTTTKITTPEVTEPAQSAASPSGVNDDKNDKNNTLPGKEDDHNSMVDDDSAQQLKKKEESAGKTGSGNVIFVSCGYLFLSVLITTYGNIVNTIT